MNSVPPDEQGDRPRPETTRRSPRGDFRHAPAAVPAAELASTLAPLVSDSLRALLLADAAVRAARARLDPASPAPDSTELDDALARLASAAASLQDAHAVVGLSMSGRGFPATTASTPVTLAGALHHAADALADEAARRRVRVEVHTDAALAHLPAGSVYAAALHAARDAVARATSRVEIVASRGGSGPGHAAAHDWALVQVIDDGPPGDDPERAAMGRALMRVAGGAVQRLRRTDDAGGVFNVIRLSFPAAVRVP